MLEEEYLKRLLPVLQKHWGKFIIIVVLLSSFTFIAFRITRKIRAKRKVEHFKIEEVVLDKLMKKAQLDRYSTGKLSALTYGIRMQKYREKLSDIKGKLPVYEAISRGEKPKNQKKKRFSKFVILNKKKPRGKKKNEQTQT